MPQATTPAAPAADRFNVLASMRQSLAAAEALANDAGDDFIVICQGVPLAATAEGDMVVAVRSAGLTTASRFSEADASALAAVVRNGNGVAGKAVALAAFAKSEADSLRATLALVDQRAAAACDAPQPPAA